MISEEEISLEERIQLHEFTYGSSESPSSASAKEKAKQLVESADEMVANPQYRDLVKIWREF